MMICARRFALLVLPFLFAGCSLFEPNPYLPSTAGGIWGYAESPVAPDTLEVGYVGLKNTATSYRFAALRASELTLQAGKPSFEILVERDSTGRHIEEVDTTTTDAEGNTTTTVSYVTIYYPMETLLIRMLKVPRPGALDAADLLHQAQEDGIHLAPATVALLAAAPSVGSSAHASAQKN